ncbi:MAG: HEAT repeat domain-containing protein [Deltaproteobacteria bacterium]|nr:HEAT repeat domain-containing protein [Deltaproteobacteria bacterium]
MRNPLPVGTRIMLNINIPLIDKSFKIIGDVEQSFDRHARISGIKVRCEYELEKIIPEMEAALAENEIYRRLLGIEEKAVQKATAPVAGKGDHADAGILKKADSGDSGLTMEWIRDAVAVEEIAREDALPPVPEKVLQEKLELTAQEREEAEPSGYFIMNLTRAMLRSGYYDPGHPGAKDAKHGLYDEFLKVMGPKDELMVTNRETREHSDILIIGMLDDPVSIRTLVGPGVSGLFVPKLKEYCNRKELVSFTIKREIIPDHFEAFVDIMGDPHVEQREHGTPGQYLTGALVEKGITEISAVFIDDMVQFERALPWRVEMAIQRLAKDLRVMPMFVGFSAEKFKDMKQNIVADIIRPLRHPRLLNDFLVNCYIISKHVEGMDAEDIEEMIVEAFPFNQLVPTVQFTFEEFESLALMLESEPDNAAIAMRLMGIKRILKHIARRVLTAKSAGGVRFLDQLYQHEIMSFEELPKDVRYVIKTRLMADDVRNNCENYTDGIQSVETPEDALVYLKCFRRSIPLLLETRDWGIVIAIARAVNNATALRPIGTREFSESLKAEKGGVVVDEAANEIFFKLADIEDRPVIYVFKEVAHDLAMAFREHMRNPLDAKATAAFFNELIDILGHLGTEILSRVLAAEINPMAWKRAIELMKKRGGAAVGWAGRILSISGQPLSLYLASIEVLSGTGMDESDFEVIRPFLTNKDPRLRRAALDSVTVLKPYDAEGVLISALNDPDARVRWHALRAIDKFAPISESSMIEMLSMIMSDAPKAGTITRKDHFDRTIRLISAINGMWQIPIPLRIESDIIATIEKYIPTGSVWKRVIGQVDENANLVLKSAVPLLVRIGGKESKAFFKRLKYPGSPYGDVAADALAKITAAEG